MKIRKIAQGENVPIELLLLADPSVEMIETYRKQGECYVAVVEQEIIGTYVLLSIKPGIVEIMNIAVKEKWQGKGMGKQLVMDAIHQARKNGYRAIEVGTGNSSIAQLYLYQKCGFKMIGIDLNFFTRHYSNKIYENGIQCRDMIRLSLDL